MSLDQIYLDTRVAGQVIRYHTWPQIRQQSVAEHSWQLLRIYSCVTDVMMQNFVLHILYHDTGELTTGDLPYPIKSNNPILKEQIENLEKESINKQAKHWNPVLGNPLSKDQYALFKLIELVEMAEWGIDELTRGSQYGGIVADRCLKVVHLQLTTTKVLPLTWKRLALYISKRLLLTEQDVFDSVWWDNSSYEKCRVQEIKNVISY